MFDRFLIGGAEPTTAPLKLTSIAPLYTDKPNDEKNLLDNRELGLSLIHILKSRAISSELISLL